MTRPWEQVARDDGLRYQIAAARALDDGEPDGLRGAELAAWYEGLAGEFAEKTRTSAGNDARMNSALHEDAASRARVLRKYGCFPGQEDEL